MRSLKRVIRPSGLARLVSPRGAGTAAAAVAVLLGAYAAGVLCVIGWMLKRPYRWLRRVRD